MSYLSRISKILESSVSDTELDGLINAIESQDGAESAKNLCDELSEEEGLLDRLIIRIPEGERGDLLMSRGDLRTRCALERLRGTRYRDLDLDGDRIKGLIEQVKRETEMRKRLQEFIHQSIEIARIVADALKRVVGA